MGSEFAENNLNMLDVENCGKWISKRNFKLENFLRKHLRQADTGWTRYYETCVIERKGALLLQNVVLTDQAIHFTENPPKSFNLSIPLSDIEDVSLVADRKTLIKGGNNNSYICQHIRIVYKASTVQKAEIESSPETKLKISKGSQSSNNSSSFSFRNAVSTDNIYSSSSFNSSRDVLFTGSPDFPHRPKEIPASFTSDPETSVTLSDISRQSSSMDHSYIPMSIYYAYEPIVTPPSPRRNGVSKSSSTALSFLNVNANYAESTSDESVRTLSSSSGSLQVISDIKQSHISKKSSKLRSDARNVENVNNKSRSEYSDLEYEKENPIFKKGINGQSTEYKRSRGLSSRGVVDSRANFLLEQRPSWRQEGEDGKSTKSESKQRRKDGQDPHHYHQKEKRRPRSVDISQLSNLRKKIIGKMFGGSGNEKDGTLSNSPHKSSTPELVRVNNASEFQDGKKEVRVVNQELADDKNTQVVNFYLYQPTSALLNELFLFWNRLSLNCTFLMMDETDFFSEWADLEVKNCPSLRAAEKVFTKLSLKWSPFDSSLWKKSGEPPLTFSILLPKLGALHKALRKYDHLKRLCWKNWNMVVNLLGILRRCTIRQDLIGEEDLEDEDYFLDKVSAISIIMDIFRSMYEACGTCWFVEGSKSDVLVNDNNNDTDGNYYDNKMWKISSEEIPVNLHQVTNFLLRTIFGCSIIPHPGISGQKEIIEIVCNPQKFATARWFYYPDSKTIKLITMGHNASVALLHEILSIVHFSSKDNERAKFMSYLRNCPMEAYTKLSVTQVMNMLWANGRPIGPSQAVLLYRHVSVLKTLLETVPDLKSFVQDTFCEEFRYFVHAKSANKRIPDRYPLKPKLLATCDELRQEIIGK